LSESQKVHLTDEFVEIKMVVMHSFPCVVSEAARQNLSFRRSLKNSISGNLVFKKVNFLLVGLILAILKGDFRCTAKCVSSLIAAFVTSSDKTAP